MQIGQSKDQSSALGVLNLEGDVDEALLEQVQAIDAVEQARLVR